MTVGVGVADVGEVEVGERVVGLRDGSIVVRVNDVGDKVVGRVVGLEEGALVDGDAVVGATVGSHGPQLQRVTPA